MRVLPIKEARCIQGGGIAVLIGEEICHFVGICEAHEDMCTPAEKFILKQ